MVVLPVPEALCRECGLCCRFSDPEVLTPWATRPEGETLLPALFRAERPIALVSGTGKMNLPVQVCDAFDPSTSRCTLWGRNPADCRLYPLVLVVRNGFFLLALDPDCPFSQKKPFSYFLEWAERFRDLEWSRLREEEISRLLPLAEAEDRPHYREVLSLGETGCKKCR